jgi:ABC-type amino acid transport substrate-binding protein
MLQLRLLSSLLALSSFASACVSDRQHFGHSHASHSSHPISSACRRPAAFLSQLRHGRPLIVGGVENWPPFNFNAPDGTLTGMDREIISAVAERSGIDTVVFKTFLFAELPNALRKGEIDVIANNYWATPSHKSAHALSIPYYKKGGYAIMWLKRARTPLNTLARLNGKRVAVVTGSVHAAMLLKNGTAIVVAYDNATEAFDGGLLLRGEVDAIMGPFTNQRYFSTVGSYSSFESSPFAQVLIDTQSATFAFRKDCAGDSSLLQAMNHALAAMWDDGSLYDIKKTYLAEVDIEPAKQLAGD